MVEETSTATTQADRLIARIAALEAQARTIGNEIHTFKQQESAKAEVRADTKMIDKLRGQILNQ